jgi:tetratricopeptide (TPR) repeat protein
MTSKFLLLICTLSGVLTSMAQQDRHQSARDQLNQGVASYRAAQYEDAIEHFNFAVHWDPDLKVARLYLATAYAQQYIPGVETPENVALATSALEQYSEVLRRDPASTTAVKGTAFLNMQLKRFDEAREAYKRAAAIDPEDPEAFYSVGVIDWTIVYRNVMGEKAGLKSKSEYAMVMSSACRALRTENLSTIEDGIAMLTRAIDLRKDYDDAMAYMNLLYRLRAEIQCGDKAAHAADVKKANEWSDLAMAARRKKAEAAAKLGQGIVTDSPRR